MIDLHCHILPGVDDGARNLEESLAMANKAVSQGITHILCTPHHLNGKYENKAADVIQKVEQLQLELEKRQIPLTLLEGQEVRINGALLEEIEQHTILFTDLTDHYILIEFPTMDIPAYTEKLFYELFSKGYTPVIVHPERNAKFREDPNLLLPFIEMGVLTQLTAPSIVGVFGKEIKKTALQMMAHNLLHMVASDAHGVERRNFYLKEAYELIEQKFGGQRVEEMKQVAKDLINGDKPKVPQPEAIVRKKFGFF